VDSGGLSGNDESVSPFVEAATMMQNFLGDFYPEGFLILILGLFIGGILLYGFLWSMNHPAFGLGILTL